MSSRTRLVIYELRRVGRTAVMLPLEMTAVVVPPLPVLAQPRDSHILQPRVVLVLVKPPVNEEER